MAHCVLVANQIAARDVAAWVRPVVCASAVDNGNAIVMAAKSTTTGEGEVWTATAPASASATSVWMAMEPEIPFLASGTNRYNGIGTIKDFYNLAGKVFTAVKLQVGDIITITSDGLDSGTTNTYAAPAAGGTFTWKWAAGYSTGCNLRYLATKYIPYADGTIGDSKITTFQFEVYGTN